MLHPTLSLYVKVTPGLQRFPNGGNRYSPLATEMMDSVGFNVIASNSEKTVLNRGRHDGLNSVVRVTACYYEMGCNHC